jgi:putative redox protein
MSDFDAKMNGIQVSEPHIITSNLKGVVFAPIRTWSERKNMEPVTVTLTDGYFATAQAGPFKWHADLADDEIPAVGPNPEQLLMGALGACMAQTAKLYAARKGWQVDSIRIDLSFKRFRGDEYPAYDGDANFVHEIREAIQITGDLTPEQEIRMREIVTKCPVRRLISNPVFFVESIPAAAGD